MGFKTTYDNVVVKVKIEEAVSAGGLVLASVPNTTFSRGTVKYVGEGRRSKSGDLIPMTVKIDDTVLFFVGTGTKIKVDGEDLTLLKEEHIFATE